MSDEFIVCAANYIDTGKEEIGGASRGSPKTGLVFCGLRHGDCIKIAEAWWSLLDSGEQERIIAIDGRSPHGVQGFLTSNGRFVERKEALEIMLKLGPLPRRCGGDNYQLYSENLY